MSKNKVEWHDDKTGFERSAPLMQAGDGSSTNRPATIFSWQALKTLSPKREWERFTTGKVPCTRQSLLLGIGTGSAIAAVGMIARRNLRSSLNWGVGSFAVVSVAAHQNCQATRRAEAQRMKVIVNEFKSRRNSGSAGGVKDGSQEASNADNLRPKSTSSKLDVLPTPSRATTDSELLDHQTPRVDNSIKW